jgi:hypothetical protein
MGQDLAELSGGHRPAEESVGEGQAMEIPCVAEGAERDVRNSCASLGRENSLSELGMDCESRADCAKA